MYRRRRWYWGVPVVVLGAGCAVWAASPSAHPTPPQPSPTASPVVLSDDPCQGTVLCVLNPQVIQATINQTICVPGWTRTVRPPVTYTDTLKRQQMQQLGLPGFPSDYEEDHRVPLELGGSPSDPHNLTPEPHTSSSAKDSEENLAKAAVCSGQKTLRQAQQDFIDAWLAPWPGYKK